MNLRLILLASLLATPVFAQEMPFLSGGGLDAFAFAFEHQRSMAPRSDPGLSFSEQNAKMVVPLYKDSATAGAFTARGTRTEMGEEIEFQESGTKVPRLFGSADFGYSWMTEKLSGDKYGMSASYGDAGTDLFSGDNKPNLAATFFYEDDMVETSWVYFITYSNNRTTLNNIPIPGIAYVIKKREYTAAFGLPFLFWNWRPDPWNFTTFASPFGVAGEAAYRFFGPLQTFGSLSWAPKAYQNLVEDEDDRVIFDKKEVDLGFRVSAGRMASLSVAYVYNFDRRFLLGESINDHEESFSIGDSAGIQAKFKASF